MSLDDLESAAPGDSDTIRRLRIRQTWQGQYPLIQRHSYDGPERPVNELETYTAIMRVLTERVERARGRQVTSIKARAESAFGSVELRFPARGDEEDHAHDYFEVSFRIDMFERGTSRRVECIARVLAPATAKWPHIVKALRQAGREAGFQYFYLDQLVEPDDTVLLWFGHGSAVEPSPTVGQLSDLDSVAVPSGKSWHMLSIEPATAPAEAGISASLIRLSEGGPP